MMILLGAFLEKVTDSVLLLEVKGGMEEVVNGINSVWLDVYDHKKARQSEKREDGQQAGLAILAGLTHVPAAAWPRVWPQKRTTTGWASWATWQTQEDICKRMK